MLDRKARGLTADAKQKISLGRGMVRKDVNAILFDEPLTVIDPQMKWELRTQLKQLHREFGHTMIYVTHDQTEALTFADRVVVMHEGRVVQMGTPAGALRDPGPHLRRLLHRLAGHEPPRRRRSTATAPASATATVPLGRDYGRAAGPDADRHPPRVRPPDRGRGPAGDGAPGRGRRPPPHRPRRALRPATSTSSSTRAPPCRPDAARVTFEPGKINVYADDWRVAGSAG